MSLIVAWDATLARSIFAISAPRTPAAARLGVIAPLAVLLPPLVTTLHLVPNPPQDGACKHSSGDRGAYIDCTRPASDDTGNQGNQKGERNYRRRE